MADKKLSIYERLAEARKMFHGLELKKSGHNKFAGYTYFELADFVIPGMDCMKANGLVPVVNFDREYATMTIHDFDGNAIIINSPMETANLKGCHPIQNLGAVETYQRRYLWMAALEIVEHDALDSAKPLPEVKEVAKASKDQKLVIITYKQEGFMPKRREAWCNKEENWADLTDEQARTIISECVNLKQASNEKEQAA